MSRKESPPPTLLIDGTTLRRNSKGVSRYAYNICCQLDKKLPSTWKIIIVTFDWELPRFEEEFRGEFIKIPYKTDLELGLRYFPKLIDQLNPHVFVRSRESIGLNYNVPTVTICHDLNELIWDCQPPRSLVRRIFDHVCQRFRIYAMRHSDLVICNSTFVCLQVSRKYNILPQNIKIAYCGVDTRFYVTATNVCKSRVQHLYDDQEFILAFATGDYRENFIILPSLFSHLKSLGYPGVLVIAGVDQQATYATNLKQDFSHHNLIQNQDYFIEPFLGEAQFTDLINLYTAADFYLELSLHEGFGMQLAEAMVCGTLCISSGRGALEEVGGEWAIKVDPNSPEAIAQSILLAWKSEEHKLDRFDQIQYIKSSFNWDKVGETLINFIEKNV